MNITDEILNSWTDADELLADKIENVESEVCVNTKNMANSIISSTGCTVTDFVISTVGDLVFINGKLTFTVNASSGSTSNVYFSFPYSAIEPTMFMIPTWNSDVSKRFMSQAVISGNKLFIYACTGNPDTTNGQCRFQGAFRYK